MDYMVSLHFIDFISWGVLDNGLYYNLPPNAGHPIFAVFSNIPNLSLQFHEFFLFHHSERIVMTPKKKTSNSTTLKMERKRILQSKSNGDAKVHVAGGSNAGIIVNKQQIGDQDDEWANIGAHLCLEFRVFLINVATKKYTQVDFAV
jgi:hypothetical protein